VISLVAPSLVLSFLAGAITLILLAEQAGRDLPPGEALRGAARRGWALAVAWLLVHVVEALALVALVLPAFAAMAFFLVVAPAAVAEHLGPLAAMKRSWRLCRRRFWFVLGVGVLSGFVAFSVEQVLGLLPAIVADELGGTAGWVVLAAGQSLATLVTTPALAATTVLLYLDLRLRLEGLDLELDVIEVFGAPPR
jgi:hypothetical protein